MRLQREGEGLRVLAPAKLNLFLEVLGRRDDGYHEIETLMVPVTLFDEIRLRRIPSGIELACEGDSRGVPEDGRNLAWRAAEAALARLARGGRGRPGGVGIRLRKGIPAGAGLGGGSSDAAATLLGVHRLFGAAPSPRELGGEAAALGSDVPFFLHGRAAVCRGRGERVEPLSRFRSRHYVLVVPGLRVATKEVFECPVFDLTPGHERRKIGPGLLMGEEGGFAAAMFFNRLEDAAYRMYPELRALAGEIERVTGRRAVMTGSGSGLFLTAADAGEARELRSRLEIRLGRGGVEAFALETAHGEGAS